MKLTIIYFDDYIPPPGHLSSVPVQRMGVAESEVTLEPHGVMVWKGEIGHLYPWSIIRALRYERTDSAEDTEQPRKRGPGRPPKATPPEAA